MTQLIFNSAFPHVFDAVKIVLKLYKCEEIICDRLNGQISARKKSNLTNRTAIINVQIKDESSQFTNISVQIHHTDTAGSNEHTLNEFHQEEIIELIRQNIKAA